MRPVEARYEDGLLKPEHPLPLRAGERVGVILVRRPDPARWDLARIAATAGGEDEDLAGAGLDDWAAALDRQVKRGGIWWGDPGAHRSREQTVAL